MEHDIQSDYNPVEQEDGYISPTPSMSKDVDDLSSPVRPGPVRSYQDIPQDDYDFEVDPISSPPRADPSEHPQHPSSQHARANPLPKVLVEASPEVISRKQVVTKNEPSIKLDLRYSFGDEPSSEIDCDDVDSSPLSPSPLTPDELVQRDLDRIVPWDDLELEDPEEKELMASASRTKIVAAGWRNRWALDSSRTTASIGRNASFTLLQRRETNVTPEGRHRISRPSSSPLVVNSRIASSSKSASRSAFQSIANPIKGRKSLTFFGEAVNNIEGSTESQVHIDAGPEVNPEILPETRLRLQRFRCQ
ncbi:hypothetical protein BT96DRAFT_53307 [Gymnopus androsaceus JB14]|uniref:Uncharacterized protein n=1 Tax=Gymnopus androsaceus JB14 TaxID=1447944 RepID=A0A6A4IB64_9AGAR|nr:hypothetical protein BT96DRAFT_53307 [Gymnopus androsaceus JB14]